MLHHCLKYSSKKPAPVTSNVVNSPLPHPRTRTSRAAEVATEAAQQHTSCRSAQAEPARDEHNHDRRRP